MIWQNDHTTWSHNSHFTRKWGWKMSSSSKSNTGFTFSFHDMLTATGFFPFYFFFPGTMNRSYLLHSREHGPKTFPALIPYGEGRMFRNCDVEDKGWSKYCISPLQKWNNGFSDIFPFFCRKPKINVVQLCSVMSQQKSLLPLTEVCLKSRTCPDKGVFLTSLTSNMRLIHFLKICATAS